MSQQWACHVEKIRGGEKTDAIEKAEAGGGVGEVEGELGTKLSLIQKYRSGSCEVDSAGTFLMQYCIVGLNKELK